MPLPVGYQYYVLMYIFWYSDFFFTKWHMLSGKQTVSYKKKQC